MNKDRKAVYEAYIAPLMSMVAAQCKEHNVPYVATFQLDLQENSELFHKSYLADADDGERLHQMIDLLEYDVATGEIPAQPVDTHQTCVVH